MMRAFVLRGLVTAVAAGSIGWLARAPYSPPGSEAAVLRLSWRLLPERTEHCRRLSREELEKLPVHMRTPTVCERETGHYQLILQIDDDAPDTTRLMPRGAHRDRPIFVSQDHELEAGTHRVRVWLVRDSPGRKAEREEHEERRHEREEQERQRERRTLRIDTSISARVGVIELITLDPVARQLVHVTSKNPG